MVMIHILTTLPTHESLLKTCTHTPKPPINTSIFASIFSLDTFYSQKNVPIDTCKHIFHYFLWSKHV